MELNSCMTEFVQFIEFDENPFIMEKLDCTIWNEICSSPYRQPKHLLDPHVEIIFSGIHQIHSRPYRKNIWNFM